MTKITADMLPTEGGEVIRFFYGIMYPDGQTVDELKNSPHRFLRNIGSYFEKEAMNNGNGN